MAKAGDKVGEAFVTLGLDKSPFLMDMDSVHKSFESSLKTMSGMASAAGKAMLGALGLTGGAAGTLAFFEKMGDSLKPFQDLAAAAGRIGVEFSKVEADVDKYLPGWRELVNLSREEGAALAVLAMRQGQVGEEMNKTVTQAIILAKQGGKGAKGISEMVDRLARGKRGEMVRFEDVGAFGPAGGLVSQNVAAAERLAGQAEPLVRSQMKFPSAKVGKVKPYLSDLTAGFFEFAEEIILDREQAKTVDMAKGVLEAMRPGAPSTAGGRAASVAKALAKMRTRDVGEEIVAGAEAAVQAQQGWRRHVSDAFERFMVASTVGAAGVMGAGLRLLDPTEYPRLLRERSSGRQDLLSEQTSFQDAAAEVGSGGFTGDERQRRLRGGTPSTPFTEDELGAKLDRNAEATEKLANEMHEALSLLRIR